MTKNRMEAFSDGVLAIVITIMVLEMKVPHGGSLQSLKPLIPVFFELCTKFHLYRDLLEQSSSHASYG